MARATGNRTFVSANNSAATTSGVALLGMSYNIVGYWPLRYLVCTLRAQTALWSLLTAYVYAAARAHRAKCDRPQCQFLVYGAPFRTNSSLLSANASWLRIHLLDFWPHSGGTHLMNMMFERRLRGGSNESRGNPSPQISIVWHT